MQYLLDSNIFIEPKNRYYACDIVPSFWIEILKQFQQKKIVTIDAVSDEIIAGGDNLSKWFNENIKSVNPQDFILDAKANTQVLMQYRDIAQRVFSNTAYAEDQKQRFLSGADPWLIASAKVWNMIVVTSEVMPGAGSTKVKIPDICSQVSVQYTDLFSMMRSVHIML